MWEHVPLLAGPRGTLAKQLAGEIVLVPAGHDEHDAPSRVEPFAQRVLVPLPDRFTPFWRVTITVNDKPENLMVLPPLDDSLEDKLLLLRAFKRQMPMPTVTNDERRAFSNRLQSELPAFVHFLTTWEIPPALVSSRFGVAHFHHPELVEAINSLAPEQKLLNLLEVELFPTPAFDAWYSPNRNGGNDRTSMRE
jgi:hypothetical protein